MNIILKFFWYTVFAIMKIAFDIRGVEGGHGGKGIWTANVLRSLLHNDRENEFLLYTNAEPPSAYTHLPNVRVIKIWGRGPLWHWWFYRSMLHEKTDILIATESYIVPWMHDPAKLKVGLVVHDLVAFKSPARHQRKATLIERLTLRNAVKKSRWIFTVSDYTRRDLVERYPELHLESKTTVVHAGVREAFARRFDANKLIEVQRRYNLDPDYVMMAGTLEPRKNIIGALEAYNLISPGNQQRYRFVIAGKKGWYTKKIFSKVKELKLVGRVKFLEYIPDEDLAVLMQGAKVFLFPSFYEGFGLPVLEAMACGTPVLASRVTSIPELGVDAVHYVDPFDPVDIADGLTQLLDNQEYRRTLRDRSFEQIKNFSWGQTANLILNAITEETGNRKQETV